MQRNNSTIPQALREYLNKNIGNDVTIQFPKAEYAGKLVNVSDNYEWVTVLWDSRPGKPETIEADRVIYEHEPSRRTKSFRDLATDDKRSTIIGKQLEHHSSSSLCSSMDESELSKEYTWTKILDHVGPLRASDSKYRGSPYSLKILWADGSITYEPLTEFAVDSPVAVARYAKDNDLLDTDGWKSFRDLAPDDKRSTIMGKQAEHHSSSSLCSSMDESELCKEYTWTKILDHVGPLRASDSKYRGSPYSLKILWADGSITYEPLTEFAVDSPVAVARYAKDNDLLDTDGWKRFRHLVKKDKRTARIMKQADHHSSSDSIISMDDTNSTMDFRLDDSEKNIFMLGDFFIERVIATANRPEPNSFLQYQWRNRILLKDIQLKDNVVIQSTMDHDGFKLQLISAKVHSEAKGGFFFTNQENVLRVAYGAEAGPNIEKLSVKDELLKIADFSSLSTSKVVSRLGLLQSTAHKLYGKPAIRILDSSLFCEVDELGHIGCGFISEDMLNKVCGSTQTAARVTCIQVRLIIPRMGLYKGVLMRKQITNGPPIQLPLSMRKVGPSLDPTYGSFAFLLICQAGMDPSSTNVNVSRLPSIDSSSKPPPLSFRPKPLSDMIKRLFMGLMVPQSVVDRYYRQSTSVKGLEHAFVRGVADPTGKIPSGRVYVTGVSNKEAFGDSIFITRSPCIKCSDARTVSVVSQRPSGMSASDWEFLESLSFGTVIFGFPKKGYKPLPEMISSGDLDGDRYFICWSAAILQHVVTDVIRNTLIPEEQVDVIKRNPNWFEDAQELLIDTERIISCNQLIGKLYMLSLKAADESELFMRDQKAEAFADAYYSALDCLKNGNKVMLPKELHELVPEKLREYLDEA